MFVLWALTQQLVFLNHDLVVSFVTRKFGFATLELFCGALPLQDPLLSKVQPFLFLTELVDSEK